MLIRAHSSRILWGLLMQNWVTRIVVDDDVKATPTDRLCDPPNKIALALSGWLASVMIYLCCLYI